MIYVLMPASPSITCTLRFWPTLPFYTLSHLICTLMCSGFSKASCSHEQKTMTKQTVLATMAIAVAATNMGGVESFASHSVVLSPATSSSSQLQMGLFDKVVAGGTGKDDLEDDLPDIPDHEEPPPLCSLSPQVPSQPPDQMEYCFDEYIPPPDFDPIPEEDFEEDFEGS